MPGDRQGGAVQSGTCTDLCNTPPQLTNTKALCMLHVAIVSRVGARLDRASGSIGSSPCISSSHETKSIASRMCRWLQSVASISAVHLFPPDHEQSSRSSAAQVCEVKSMLPTGSTRAKQGGIHIMVPAPIPNVTRRGLNSLLAHCQDTAFAIIPYACTVVQAHRTTRTQTIGLEH